MIIPSTKQDKENGPSSSQTQSYRLKRGTKLEVGTCSPNKELLVIRSDVMKTDETQNVPPQPTTTVPPLSALDGPFQLSEYLALKVKHDPHDIKGLVEVPKSDAALGGKAPQKTMVRHNATQMLDIQVC